MVLIPGVNSRKVGVGTFDAKRRDPNHKNIPNWSESIGPPESPEQVST